MSVISDYDELKGFVTECVNEALELAKKQEKADAEKADEESRKTVSDLVEEKIKNYEIRR